MFGKQQMRIEDTNVEFRVSTKAEFRIDDP